MDFFGAQERAKRNTCKLVLLFALAVLGIIAAVYFAVAGVLAFSGARGVWHGEAFSLIAGLTLLVVGGGALFRTMQLRSGGAAVAQMLGGTPVHPSTRDLQEKTLYNVVEEMAIASGVPMPSVFVLSEEAGINAFAAGHSHADAAIAVTRGTLEALDRDELQGVVAHEFSHVLNADMRLNLRLMAVLFGLTCIATGGYLVMRAAGRTSSSNRKGGGAQFFLVGLALYVVGSLGKLFATLIQAAVSRQREFLADAAAVQFTRNPRGIAGALQKIQDRASGGTVRSPQAAEASHLFFADALVHRVTSLFASHPPLADRIRAIAPMFAKYPPRSEVRESVRAATPAQRPAAAPAGPLPRIPGMPSIPGLPAIPGTPGLPIGVAAAHGGVVALSPEQIVGAVGSVDGEQLAASHDWLAQLDPALRLACNDALGASALLFALLLDARTDVRSKQLAALAQQGNASAYAETLNLARHTGALPVAARLPLLDLALPALRAMSPAQYVAFQRSVDGLVHADQEVTLFEFALGRVLRRHLARAYERRPLPRVAYNTLLPVLPACALVLSALAHGSDDDAHAAHAFAAGAEALPRVPGSAAPALVARANCSTTALGSALDALARVSPRAKQQFMRAAARVVAADGRAVVAELELLRAIADSIDVPVPPLGLAA